MKKLLSMVLAFVMVFAFAGCNNNENEKGVKKYSIGVTQFADHPSLDNCRKGFIEGLKDNGFIEGENLEIEFKSAQTSQATANQIAEAFANNSMDLVCGIATISAQSLYSVCKNKNIPVVFNAISDPVTAKLAENETKGMEGVTGVSDKLPVKDQLELIRKIMPDAKKIGILYTLGEANSVSTIKTYKELAGNYGFEIVDKGITKQAEVVQALDVLLSEVDAISNMTDNTVVTALPTIIDRATAKNIPVFGSEEEQVKNGCIACAGIDYVALGKKAGNMASKILKGEDINTIPIETVDESIVSVNEEVAKKLNITIPEGLVK